MRNLVSRAFTPKVIAELEPRIEQITHQLLDQVIEAGEMDLIGDFSIPLPVTVIAEMLGVPASDYLKFKEWSDLTILGGEEMMNRRVPAPHMVEAERALCRYLADMSQERKARPQPDLISSLVAVNIDGAYLSTEEIVETGKLLLVAGNETTTNLIGNAIVTLLEHPESLARLQAEPELMPSAIEEVLRYRPSTQFMVRMATRDVELGGQLVQAGQRLIGFLASGNRDEKAFPEPDRFDIARSPNRHLGFGHGIHFCLGAPLARLEGRIALTAILQRLRDLRLADGEAVEVLPSKLIYGLKRLNVRFTPGAKVSA
jgi:cytochrome P450